MKIKKLVCLAAACMLSLGMTTAVFADTIPASTSVSYDGKSLSNAATDLTDAIKGVQPGDTAEIAVDLYNKSGNTAYYYLTTSIAKSFEDASLASNGAYTFSLVYKNADGTETVLYSNDAVGGDKKEGALVGLNQVQITQDGSYVYLDAISADKTGTVILRVSLDGNTQDNSYMNTLAELKLSFAVESAASPVTVYEEEFVPGDVVTIKKPDTVVTVQEPNDVIAILEEIVPLASRTPETGDVLMPLALSTAGFFAGLVLLVWAVVLMRKQNEREAL